MRSGQAARKDFHHNLTKNALWKSIMTFQKMASEESISTAFLRFRFSFWAAYIAFKNFNYIFISSFNDEYKAFSLSCESCFEFLNYTSLVLQQPFKSTYCGIESTLLKNNEAAAHHDLQVLSLHLQRTLLDGHPKHFLKIYMLKFWEVTTIPESFYKNILWRSASSFRRSKMKYTWNFIHYVPSKRAEMARTQ